MSNNLEKILIAYNLPITNKIVCPFHADKNPSLQIDLDKDFWYCFGCQEGGNAFKFHDKYQRQILGNNNSIKIAQQYESIMRNKKITLNVSTNYVVPEKRDKAWYRQKLIEAKDDYYGLKFVNWYLLDNECVDYMKSRGFKKKTLNMIGAKYTYNDVTYPIMFPILDNGHFKGYVKRTFDPEIEGKRKYLYNTGFRRDSSLGGTYEKSNTVMIVEGYLDMLKAKQHGAKNVVCLFGWKMTEKQAEKLKAQGIKVIISALDNDECGIKGTKFVRTKFKMLRFRYPDGVKDIGEISKADFTKECNRIKQVLKRRNISWE